MLFSCDPRPKAILLTFIATGLSASSVHAQQCPDYDAPAAMRVGASSEFLYSRQSFRLEAGGSYNLEGCLEPNVSTGYVKQGPDLRLEYDDLGFGRELRIEVTGSCDTVLLVNTPDGDYLYVDDVTDQDPLMSFMGAESGQYDIWVGTFSPSLCTSTVELETF